MRWRRYAPYWVPSTRQWLASDATASPMLPPGEWLQVYALFASHMHGGLWTTWRQPLNRKYITHCNVVQGDLATPVGNVHRELSGDWTSGSWDTHTHTHTFNGPFLGLPGWAGTRKVKPIWILLKQETVSSSGISRAICKSAPHSRQITTPAPHHSVFYRPDALPDAQPTVSKHWRKVLEIHLQTNELRDRQASPLSDKVVE